MSATEFWQEHQVAEAPANWLHSMAMLAQRRNDFPDLEDLMPTKFPGKTILDFGCGPGHDTVLFLGNDAQHVWFADISWKALKITNDRLKLHGDQEGVDYRGRATALFADDELPRVDHFHSAGVLHHVVDPLGALLRLRVAADTGQVMVYDGKRSEHSTSLVPITEWWTPKEFKDLALEAGWEADWVGSYPCSSPWRPNCFAACYSLK